MGKRDGWFESTRKTFLCTMAFAGVLAFVLFAAVKQTSLHAQTAAANPTAAAERPQKQWEIDAGGKMEFDVASIKQDTAQPSPTTVHSNIPMGSMDMFAPTGGAILGDELAATSANT